MAWVLVVGLDWQRRRHQWYWNDGWESLDLAQNQHPNFILHHHTEKLSSSCRCGSIVSMIRKAIEQRN